MSQDDQNSQLPSSGEPKANQSEPKAEQITQPPQTPYQRVQPFWKTKTVQILRGTISLLETAVVKLETEPSAGPEETPNFLQKLQSFWRTVLSKIRSFLPQNLSAKLSDTALTGVIAGIAVILLWTTSSLFTTKPTEVANVPPQQVEEPPITSTTPLETLPPEVPAVEEAKPPLAEETPPPIEEVKPPLVEETPPPIEEAKPPLVEETPPPTAEVTPQEPEPTPAPTPPIILTPEQNLIAAIENQVAEVSDRFASGLIQSIQANFSTSSLTLRISDDWFRLKQSEQDKLAAQMLQRSKELDFSHLYIVDSQDKLVARNPVVGDEMIIFKRS